VFDGGRRRALTAKARALHAEAVASYRQTVLNAYGEVEDNLASLHHLTDEAVTQQAAVTAAGESTRRAQDLYKGGLQSYFNVVEAQNIELAARLSDADIRTRRIAAPPIIFMGESGDIRAAIRAMKAGAHEFLIKPLEPTQVFAAIHTALQCNWLRRNERARFVTLKSRLEGLSPRERQVLALLLAGLRNEQAASHLGISDVTVQVHRGQIMRKMRARSFAELVKIGGSARCGLAGSGLGRLRYLGFLRRNTASTVRRLFSSCMPG
jgi:FixJ family two-component response regulator